MFRLNPKTHSGSESFTQRQKKVLPSLNIIGCKWENLWSTGMTSLYRKHVPEKMIQKVTYHRLLEELQHYEKVSRKDKQAVSNVLTDVTNFCTLQEEFQQLESRSHNSSVAKVQPKQPCQFSRNRTPSLFCQTFSMLARECAMYIPYSAYILQV